VSAANCQFCPRPKTAVAEIVLRCGRGDEKKLLVCRTHYSAVREDVAAGNYRCDRCQPDASQRPLRMHIDRERSL
jgi:hypothetical protein